MDMLALIAAFGGGVIGAYLGALPAFIMTGVFATIGGLATAAGAPADIAVGAFAFGSFLGPHVAFAGGVAAAGYAGRKKKLECGADILSSLNGLGAPDVLMVGGLFGVLGYLVWYLVGLTPFGAITDRPGFTVFVLAVVTRLVFGSTGLTGKYTGTEKRQWISRGNAMWNTIVLGGGIGVAVSFVAASLAAGGASDTVMGIFPIICFGFSAITLIFTQTGFACPATHHITLPAGLAAVAGIAAWGSAGALLGVLFGILSAVFGDFVGKTFNSYVDSHIDPPATTIFVMTCAVSLVKMAIF
jgi:hypothetical protein